MNREFAECLFFSENTSRPVVASFPIPAVQKIPDRLPEVKVRSQTVILGAAAAHRQVRSS